MGVRSKTVHVKHTTNGDGEGCLTQLLKRKGIENTIPIMDVPGSTKLPKHTSPDSGHDKESSTRTAGSK